jgi:AraC-like DNA-binding protein
MNKPGLNISFIENFRNLFRDKISMSICCISSLLLITGYFVFFQKSPLKIFPGNKDVIIRSYTDRADNGNSVIENLITSDTLISEEFILRKGFVRPYVGIGINPNHVRTDISDFNQLNLEVKGDGINNITVNLVTCDSVVKAFNGKFPLKYYSGTIELTSEKQLYKLNLRNLKVPDWWYDINNRSPADNMTPNWRNLVDISIGTGLTPTIDKHKTLDIYSLKFTRNNTRLIFYLCVIQLSIMLLLFVLRQIPTKKLLPVTIKYRAIIVDEKREPDISFLDYINNNFQDNEMTLKKIARQTGVQARQITNTISDTFGCNFKTYVNQIRINESKRLLQETELHIGEIAYKVGFNSPNHFNRVFKSFTGESPSEFLESL